MYIDSGSATLVNCELEGNSARYGGGMFVRGTATMYGCTFASNTASSSRDGPDINNWGTVSVYGCAAGSYGTQGTSLSTYGTVSGSLFSFSGCTECAR